MGDHLLAGTALGRSPPSSGFSAVEREQAGLLGSGAAAELNWAPPITLRPPQLAPLLTLHQALHLCFH